MHSSYLQLLAVTGSHWQLLAVVRSCSAFSALSTIKTNSLQFAHCQNDSPNCRLCAAHKLTADCVQCRLCAPPNLSTAASHALRRIDTTRAQHTTPKRRRTCHLLRARVGSICGQLGRPRAWTELPRRSLCAARARRRPIISPRRNRRPAGSAAAEGHLCPSVHLSRPASDAPQTSSGSSPRPAPDTSACGRPPQAVPKHSRRPQSSRLLRAPLGRSFGYFMAH